MQLLMHTIFLKSDRNGRAVRQLQTDTWTSRERERASGREARREKDTYISKERA